MKSILLVIVAALTLSSCAIFNRTADYHLRRSTYHRLMAIAKGAPVKPDTIIKIVQVPVPDVTGGAKVQASINERVATLQLIAYDSALLAEYELRTSQKNKHDQDSIAYEAQIKMLQVKLTSIRSKFKRGFSKDSTYQTPIDKNTIVFTKIKDGLLDSVGLQMRDKKIEVPVPVAVINTAQSPNKVRDWIGIALITFVILLLLAMLLGRYLKRNDTGYPY